MPEPVTTVSVVIPVRNGEATLAAQLRSLEQQDAPVDWEVVIADNGSDDATIAVARSFEDRLPSLTLVHEPERIGINAARNAGIRAARGSMILICDADDEVAPGWIAAHVAALATHDLTTGPLDHAALNSDEIAAFNEGEQNGCPVAGGHLPYTSGGNMGLRREVWERLSGFDETWVRGGTEIEFCWRAQHAGYTIGWATGARVAYRHAPGLRAEFRRRFISARSLPRLYARFQRDGMPRPPLAAAVRGWAWLIYRIPWAIPSGQWRTKWLSVLAWRAGLAAGSWRFRVLYL